jgi:hypothetical protein
MSQCQAADKRLLGRLLGGFGGLKKSCKKPSAVCDVAGGGCSGERTEKGWRTPPTPRNRLKQEIETMKTLIKLALAAVILCSTFAAQAGTVRGHYRSNGTYVAPYYRSDHGSASGYSSSRRDYVYRNPYAAYPSVSVRGYIRSNGTYVAPHYRTRPNNTVTDNLSYRGYGTVRVPRYSYGR